MKSSNVIKTIILSCIVGFSTSYANDMAFKHGPSAAQNQEMTVHNQMQALHQPKMLRQSVPDVRPFSDYEKPGYLIMTGNFRFNSKQAKLEIAKALGDDALLVLVTESDSKSSIDTLYQTFADSVPAERIRIIKLRRASNGFWARDAFPIPLVDYSGQLELLSSYYYKDVNPGVEFSKHFTDKLIYNPYYFEGGNLQTNHHGVCLIANNDRHAQMPDDVFFNTFGCQQLIRLPHLEGIGHIDEHARFINDSTIITDLDEYAQILTNYGFNIEKMPRPSHAYETYINSIQLGNHIIVPTFAEKTDEQAIATYRNLGFVVSTASSKQLSNNGYGSFHCITMVYPPVPYRDLLKLFRAEDVSKSQYLH